MRIWSVLAVLSLFTMTAIGRHKSPIDDRLKAVHTLAIAGNNQAAEGARNQLEKDASEGKGCFAAAANVKDADAVLEIGSDSSSEGGGMGAMGGRNWIASGALTTKTGGLIWQHSERFSDAAFSSGGKTAGKVLYLELRRDACGK